MFETMMLLAVALLGQAADPLAPAREGKMQCYTPNLAAKTCLAIGRFAPQPDGSYASTATALIVPQQGIALTSTSIVRPTPAGVCGTARREDILAGKVAMAGNELPPELAAPMLEQFAAATEAMGLFGKQTCTVFTPEGDLLKADVTVGGVARPELTQRLIWVRPEDGFRIGG